MGPESAMIFFPSYITTLREEGNHISATLAFDLLLARQCDFRDVEAGQSYLMKPVFGLWLRRHL